MNIDKKIYNLDTVLSLEYGEIVLHLEKMADIKLDIFFTMLNLDENSYEFELYSIQCHYLQINIDVFLEALDIIEKNLVRSINCKGNNFQLSLN